MSKKFAHLEEKVGSQFMKSFNQWYSDRYGQELRYEWMSLNALTETALEFRASEFAKELADFIKPQDLQSDDEEVRRESVRKMLVITGMTEEESKDEVLMERVTQILSNYDPNEEVDLKESTDANIRAFADFGLSMHHSEKHLRAT